MKTKSLFLILFLFFSVALKSQSSENVKGFSDIKLSYNLSFIGEDPFTTPLGAGVELTYNLNNNISIDFGPTVKPTMKQIEDSYHYGDWGPSYQMHRELSAFFLDFPIHLNYQLLSTKTFEFQISSGLRTTYFNIQHYFTWTYANQDPTYMSYIRNNVSAALDFGLIECFRLSDKIGIFASQFYGHYLIGAATGIGSTDLKIGLTYTLK